MPSKTAKSLADNLQIAKDMLVLEDEIEKVAKAIVQCFRRGGKLIFFGNGGSAADAMHIAAEYVNKFSKQRQSLPAFALSTNFAIITAIANDFDYRYIFKRQLESLANPNDLVVCLSTSGESKNAVEAMRHCREKNIQTIAFTGNTDNSVAKLSHICFPIPSADTPRIQETYLLINHIICELVDEELIREGVI